MRMIEYSVTAQDVDRVRSARYLPPSMNYPNSIPTSGRRSGHADRIAVA
jgi:hypothetical protein